MIHLFFQDDEWVDEVVSALEVFSQEVEVEGRKRPPKEAFDPSRGQLRGDALIAFLPEERPSLWLVKRDLYLKGTNFVFGFAVEGRAVLSTHRLDFDTVGSEAVHEVGHALGLEHCENDCVMKFSNSLSEAKSRPKTLCVECRRELGL